MFFEWSMIWFIAIFIFILIEIFTVSLVSIWFVAGAIAAWLLSIVHIAPIIQVVAFLVVSITLLIYTKPILENMMRYQKIPTNIDSLIGAKCIVTDRIMEYEIGEVKLDGKFWSAKSLTGDNIDIGEEVEVVKIDGVKLIVK